MEKKDASGILLSDAKPRLKWSPQLHRIFVHAVARQGGADKATPKSLMRAMGIPGLSLYHLKSHLQKHRLLKDCFVEAYSHRVVVVEGFEQNRRRNGISGGIHIQINGNLQRTAHDALQMQKKIHEQLEVQRHLEVRMEAEGKYLQSVLDHAHKLMRGGCSISMEESSLKSSSCESSVTKSASDADCNQRSAHKIRSAIPFRIMLDLNE